MPYLHGTYIPKINKVHFRRIKAEIVSRDGKGKLMSFVRIRSKKHARILCEQEYVWICMDFGKPSDYYSYAAGIGDTREEAFRNWRLEKKYKGFQKARQKRLAQEYTLPPVNLNPPASWQGPWSRFFAFFSGKQP